ncbi:uncharacterized protein TNIN_12151 [Trichonephila inaurata madagascariensis]|uniref:Transmembrane protein 268 n=1 Tax=Trichonephila inaurata madagascariensis TaxID=2747483 RepID=A0A8X7CP75_9ARAC|nr:uncharacterized protein TNIN_12151 [Trichonephila inaurata madagascariensis]
MDNSLKCASAKLGNQRVHSSNALMLEQRLSHCPMSWSAFEEDSKALKEDSVAGLSSSEGELERSSSPPHSGFSTGRNSPKTALPPPPAPSRPVRKTTSEVIPSSRSSCPPDFAQDNGHNNMQNIPLSESLTVEDYVMTMQVLVNDVRFNLYNVCYKRVLIMWIMLGFIILLSLLFSGVRGLALFGGGIVWLIVNAVGIFVCMWLKIKLYRMLEQCMASVNALMFKHRILVGLDDRGKISCHKVNLIFVYFDVSYCITCWKMKKKNNLQEAAASEPKGNQSAIDQSRMDIDTSDIIITGSNTTRVCQKEKYAERLFVRYSQRWVKEFVRKRLDLRLPLHPDGTVETGPPAPPRHCATARCPCQFIEEHLRFKPNSKCNIRELFS